MPALPSIPRPNGRAPDAPALTAFWELSADLLSIAEPSGTFLAVNPAWTRTLGWTREQMLATNALDLLHPADVEDTSRVLGVLATEGQTLDGYENRYRTVTGDYRLLRWNARTGMDGRVYSVTRDVTEERENERRLRESEERFRLAMTQSAIGMAIVDTDGRFVDVNDALCRIVGRPRDVLTTLTFQDITHPEDLDADLELVRALAAGEIDRYDLEKRYFHADGSIVWILLSGSALRDPDGVPKYYIAQIQDISQRKQAEQGLEATLSELRQANRTLTDFAAVAAHDLKSPLAIVAGMLDLLRVRFADPLDPQARDLIDRSVNQVTRLSRQVDGLLRMAATTGKPLELVPQDVPVLLDSVMTSLGDQYEDVDADSGDCPPVLADASGLMLVLQNLVENAGRHGARRVHLHGVPEGTRLVKIVVDDDGPGIPAEGREHLFELFHTGDVREGTGLGLATCRMVVQRHGGRIGIDDAPNGGARIWFTLPRA